MVLSTPDSSPPPQALTAAGPSGIVRLNAPDNVPSASSGFLQAGVSLSQSLERDPAGGLKQGADFFSLTRVFGQLQLLKLRRRSETALEYVGGGSFYSDQSTNQQLHRLMVGQHFLWPKMQLTLGDSFGDLPGGNFGSSLFGGFLSSQLGYPADTAVSDSFGSSEFGELSQASHVTNVSVAELSGTLTPRSSFNLAGGYAITAYFGDTQNLINSRQVSGRAGYSYQLSRRNEIGILYSYRRFQFPQSGAGEIGTNLIQATFARQLSRRMTLALGGGPEILGFSNPLTGATNQISGSGYAVMSYRFRQASLELSYNRQVTRGAGFFAGTKSDVGRLSVTRKFWRSVDARLDAGYARGQRLQTSVLGIRGNTYQYGFTGLSLERRLGRNATVFARYEFNDESFEDSSCAVTGGCGRQGIRHAVAFGFNWQIRPIRLQ